MTETWTTPRVVRARNAGSLSARFWRQVDRRGPDECWPWTAHTNNQGYGMIGVETRGVFHKALSHRIAWEMQNGPIPEGLKVLHRCDTPLCVNPRHLFLGTMKQNTEDMVAKGRSARGVKHGSAKLTPDEVLVIRNEYAAGETIEDLASRFCVSEWAVSDIVTNRNWKWLQPKEA